MRVPSAIGVAGAVDAVDDVPSAGVATSTALTVVAASAAGRLVAAAVAVVDGVPSTCMSDSCDEAASDDVDASATLVTALVAVDAVPLGFAPMRRDGGKIS